MRTAVINQQGVKRDFLPNTKLDIPSEQAPPPVAVNA